LIGEIFGDYSRHLWTPIRNIEAMPGRHLRLDRLG
jgi:hypothetical protein